MHSPIFLYIRPDCVFRQVSLRPTHFQCRQARPLISRRETPLVRETQPGSSNLPTCIADGSLNQPPQPTNLSTPQTIGEFGSSSVDVESSAPLLSVYSTMTEDDDNKMVKRLQKDANGILIFVSPMIVGMPLSEQLENSKVRFILCRSRGVGYPVYSRPHTKPPGRLRILPQEHLSNSRQPECL